MKIVRTIPVLLFIAFLGLSPSVSAASEVVEAFAILAAERQEGDGSNLIYLVGVGEALVILNAKLDVEAGRTFYCPPENLALNSFNYADIALKTFESKPSMYDNPVLRRRPRAVLAEALIDGLIATFPCD
ncbi:MAG: hypothetical protein JSW48_16190 [Betaproteobacteria bacterium]|jgi:hypothetical protein|nr:MAG: hypothetical protein JSW48_16190 [Betaproteobacteria bacterium]